MTRSVRLLVCLGGLAAMGTAVVVACLPDIPVGVCGNGHIDLPFEQCDPGTNANPGCTSDCLINCPGFLDTVTNHCYFGVDGSVPQTFNAARTFCVGETARGHVVTFVDDDEVGDVSMGLGGAWSQQSMLWVGDQQNSNGTYSASHAYEPGWDIPKNCLGCFLHGVVNTPSGTASIPIVDGGLEAGPPSVIVSVNPTGQANGTFGRTGQYALAEVVCEREPVGAHSTGCRAGSYCFQLPLTSQSKTYLYNPTPTPAAAAESYCRALSDGGASSLVVFGSRAEREQVIFELTQLPLLQFGGTELPTGFWIGLETVLPDAGRDSGPHDGGLRDGGLRDGGAFEGGGLGLEGGAIESGVREAGPREAGGHDAGVTPARPKAPVWTWEDGKPAGATSTSSRPSVWGDHQPPAEMAGGHDAGVTPARPKAPVWTWEDGKPAGATSTSSRPSVWGDHQPPAEMAGVYAYISLSDGFDTGLAYASTDDSTQVKSLPFICQY